MKPLPNSLRSRGGLCRSALGLLRSRDGVSTVEFAVAVPVILLIMAGTLDLGRALMARFEVSSAVSASTNYALLNADRVNSTSGSALASDIATVAASSLQSNHGDITVVINNGSSLGLNNGQPSQSGTAANADSCYCPTMDGYSVNWGSAKTCGTACTGGGVAGKFVSITASKPFSPMFTSYGFVEGDKITVRAIVQPQ